MPKVCFVSAGRCSTHSIHISHELLRRAFTQAFFCSGGRPVSSPLHAPAEPQRGLVVSHASKFRLSVVAALGIALAVYILKSIGVKDILSAAASVGWRGFAILCLYQLVLFVPLGIAWYVVVPASSSPRATVFIWARMVRDATTELLPFSHLGGILLGTRSATAQGVPQSVAFASTLTDVTTEFLAQIVYVAVGIVIWSALTPHNSAALSATTIIILVLMIIAVIGGAFKVVQRYGKRLASKVAVRLFPSAALATEAAAASIQEIFQRRGWVGLSFLLHCVGWVASAISTWIALLLMGVHVQVTSALAIESLISAARSIAFLVPNAIGIQEAAYAAIAPLFGIGAELGLAISLLKRARDVAVGVPIMLLWQAAESRRFLGYAGASHRADGSNSSR
jgi:glycosyltransferase 2 family protein